MAYTGYDFCGWATKNDLKCSDGRVIRKNAFRVNDGKKVPVFWNHEHRSIDQVLGHAFLENREDGVFAYGYCNDTPQGKNAKEILKHGDVEALSIWAGNLEQDGCDVVHGVIREVSLVPAGANPGAFVESVLAHGEPMEDGDSDAILYNNEGIVLSHAEPIKKKEEDEMPKENESKNDRTVKDVIDEMTDEQKKAVAILIGQAIKDAKVPENEKEKEDNKEMRHSIFEGDDTNNAAFSLDEETTKKILRDAKAMGSLREAIHANMEGGVLQHGDLDTTGMTVATGKSTYGFNDPSMLFPEYRNLNQTPEWIQRNMDWVDKLLSKVRHTPFSRVRSTYANITEDEARAKGYIKGKQKKEEVFSTLKRTTDPQTVYKLQKMDRDDILDITDFDVIAWIRAEMRMMLNEEIARAILMGDGRASDAEDKISPDHIRPVISDKPLFNTIVKVSVAADATEGDIANATIKAIIRARKSYKGSGRPDFWTTEDVVTEMLLLENKIGDTIYKSEAELATKLRVNEIIPVEPMEGETLTIDGKAYPLIGSIVNFVDYNVGTDKGGEVKDFDDFDIRYNQHLYLIETRFSGALIKPFSAITLVLDKAAPSSGGGSAGTDTQTVRTSAFSSR